MSPLSSKFDAFLGGKAQLTAQETQGYDLFRGKAHCNECHRDGGPGEDPLFTDFTASNIGTPADPVLPYYAEGQPDSRGYDKCWFRVSSRCMATMATSRA